MNICRSGTSSDVMKLVLAVVLSVCFTVAVASDCDSLERFKVMQQWSSAFGEGHHRTEFAVKVFKRYAVTFDNVHIVK